MSLASSALARPRRGRLYIIVGAVLALLAFATAAGIASLPFIQGSTTGIKIVVASHDIRARTVISASDLTFANFSPAPPQAFSAVRDPSGRGAGVDFPGGGPVTANWTAEGGAFLATSESPSLPIPGGWVAVTVPTSEQEGVGGYIQNGDRINMLATIN